MRIPITTLTKKRPNEFLFFGLCWEPWCIITATREKKKFVFMFLVAFVFIWV